MLFILGILPGNTELVPCVDEDLGALGNRRNKKGLIVCPRRNHDRGPRYGCLVYSGTPTATKFTAQFVPWLFGQARRPELLGTRPDRDACTPTTLQAGPQLSSTWKASDRTQLNEEEVATNRQNKRWKRPHQ